MSSEPSPGLWNQDPWKAGPGIDLNVSSACSFFLSLCRTLISHLCDLVCVNSLCFCLCLSVSFSSLFVSPRQPPPSTRPFCFLCRSSGGMSLSLGLSSVSPFPWPVAGCVSVSDFFLSSSHSDSRSTVSLVLPTAQLSVHLSLCTERERERERENRDFIILYLRSFSSLW